MDEAVERFAAVDVDWWIAGGLAIDLFLGWESRQHDDIDIEMFRKVEDNRLRDRGSWIRKNSVTLRFAEFLRIQLRPEELPNEGPMRRAFRCLQRRRAAWTLVELMTVITLVSILLVLVIAVLTSLQRIDRSWRNETATLEEFTRFAEAYRRDVHHSTDTTLVEDGNGMTVRLEGDHTINYAEDGERWLRREEQGGDQPIRTTVFRFDAGRRLRLTSTDERGRRIVTATLRAVLLSDSLGQPLPPARTPYRVDAVVSRNRDGEWAKWSHENGLSIEN